MVEIRNHTLKCYLKRCGQCDSSLKFIGVKDNRYVYYICRNKKCKAHLILDKVSGYVNGWIPPRVHAPANPRRR